MLTVVKVGGSLFDHPQLGPGLRAWLGGVRGQVLLVPGGGAFAEAVRRLDPLHQLGDEAAHWLALRAVTLAGHFLARLVPEASVVMHPSNPFPLGILDAYEFARLDDRFAGALPHSWDVTSDSVAARAAAVFRADRLVLLKSMDILPGTPWSDVAAAGAVDRHFPRVAQGLDVEAINFRRWLSESAPEVPAKTP